MGLPSERMYSAALSHSSMVAVNPRLSSTGLGWRPSSESSVKLAMLPGIRRDGCTPVLSAKFSEWMPKASKPMGSKTSRPLRRMKRPYTSAPVKA